MESFWEAVFGWMSVHQTQPLTAHRGQDMKAGHHKLVVTWQVSEPTVMSERKLQKHKYTETKSLNAGKH